MKAFIKKRTRDGGDKEDNPLVKTTSYIVYPADQQNEIYPKGKLHTLTDNEVKDLRAKHVSISGLRLNYPEDISNP